MILQGNQRGGAGDLARHLLKDENEHVEVYELRGFVADDLAGAFKEAHAISKGTKAKQFLYSLSVNPPSGENVTTEAFEDAINRAEKTLGLVGQPRAIVFHEKKGRRHAHAVWSRTDTSTMTAVPLPHTKRKLMALSRDLYIEHGWDMPEGFINSDRRDPRNFTLAQWQQAKRIGKDPKAIKQAFQDSWAVSDDQKSFAHALKERGYTLAKGDRRGFVALDHRCEVFAVAKWVGVKTKDVKAKLGSEAPLSSVSETKQTIAADMSQRLVDLQAKQDSKIEERLESIDKLENALLVQHKAQRQELSEYHQNRQREELLARQSQFRKGLRGLFDRITGQRKKLIRQHESEAAKAVSRDRLEYDGLVFKQLQERNRIERRHQRLQEFKRNRYQVIEKDINQYREMVEGKRDKLVLHPKIE
ncbi:relaxase [Porticoccus sp. W117]|uniref:relaxase/mobilization nuclease domain-containing protein n=1 Tax=Porticoccus sp. W117 TaxID=3054777 RepID=UPI002594EFCD|nr:relaxase/mobilization nuclease domain-containing protein [Porticoccus sp. W117]MDM3871784.1 relaxase [Porticoccus sp. W117]